MQKYAPFETKGSWAQRIGRYLLGIAGLLVIYLGLDLLFGLIAADATALGLVLRYIRYGAVTFWVMFEAPWVFLKLRLAEPGRKVAQDERLIERDQLPAAPRL
jgi:hypothetical protein